MESSGPLECPTTVSIRRNPHRSARPTTTTTEKPSSTFTHSLSSKTLTVPNFPLDDILSMDVHVPAPLKPTILSPKPPDSLNVFLRIRPFLAAPSKSAKSKPNLNPIKSKKLSKSCITINGSHSVTISPLNCDSNRLKTENYTGFSHVFSSDSTQDEVYEKLMAPMVEEFLNGRSGLLAALGPSGSGKTYTVFGSGKEPGLVPHALRHIFDSEAGKSRSFYISIFEIYSEKGKGEKLSDLSPHGSDIYMQQSVVKDLKEILVKDFAQAESFLTQAKSKRATAMTNSNSQSSRSQCIINIRCATDETEGKRETQLSEAVLTFVDLAGAEREKKTGNKGGRLLESNFVNNTSMVFGLCLRSLLEHQKNPKKPLQKHFQSSLLTRYLRDYLEGRKRMSLILTVRSGEEDYFDTSFLLRQASPFMEIKFRDMEEIPNLRCVKKRHQIIGNKQHKRAKLTSADSRNDVEKTSRDFENFQNKAKAVDISDKSKDNLVPGVNECTDSDIHRQYNVLQGFAKALWVVLKQYKERVKIMQKDIDILTETLRTGDAKNLLMEIELHNLKSQCSCPKKIVGLANCSLEGPNSISRFSEEQLTDHTKVVSAEVQGTADLECMEKEILHISGQNCTSRHECALVRVTAPEEPDECSVSDYQTANLSRERDLPFEVGDAFTPEAGCQLTETAARPAGNPDSDEESQFESIEEVSRKFQGPESVNVSKFTMECQISHGMSQNDCHEKDKRSDEQPIDAAARFPRSHVLGVIEQGKSCVSETLNEMDKENVRNGTGSNFNSELEIMRTSPSKPSKAGRPKRRLMPASSLLLRDAGNIDATDEDSKLRGGKGGRRLVEDEHKRTKGNASLMRLLKNHLPR